ncbi:oxidoreductase [Streptomyces brasiliensis]|uniref:NADH-dependent flavin oxidoreductase YqiG n=1 Tax=Streptomyces brasiliensis TaxID=1954 RepID=A0A917UM53_9ACTN|nr:NADH:flavin oxidoreductase [Streptomyces brasiliensis]GGJ67474.1 putative NADH-dependent flavin oxidoreductase YqiG [Streptomyces brasiliensis]
MTAAAAPLELAHGPAWAHRLVLAPLTNLQSEPDGVLGEDEYLWLVRRGEGGFAMVMTCAAHVSADGQCFPGQLGVWSDAHLPGLSRLANGLRATGAVSAVQLQHGGRRADPALSGRPVVAPWDEPAKSATALTTDGVAHVVADFGAAAARAERAGFDGVEVHGAHGYLLAQFLDARRNQRPDRYGGSLEGGLRLLLEVLGTVRERTGPDFQVGVRLSPERYGIVLGEATEVAAAVMASGLVDYLDLSLWDAFKASPEPDRPGATLLDHFVGLPRAGTRLGVAGKIVSGADVVSCLAAGVDFVSIGTAGILEHDFARRVLTAPDHPGLGQPVPRDHLVAEGVGPAFLDYLSTNWDDFVA